ncbi:MAG: hypothetical protein KBD73_02140, partial [Candidatus Magasanikbacteria bacterium]|nr:hypothetical protein [Candidatus Magasanikbacteria bacterium]
MTSITVSWTDNSNNETGFILDSSTNGTIYANVTTTGADVTSYQVTSLSGGTSYWFRVAAAGASSNSSYVTTTAATVTPSNSAPTTPASLTATPVRDTTGYITIQFTVNDSEQNVLKVKPEYKSGNCSSYSGQSTTTIAGSITATYGQSDITLTSNEADGYQIQNVTTTPGANTLSFSWNSKSNVPTADGQYCIFITSNDSTVDSTVSSTTVTLDNVYPTAPGSLSVSTSTTSTVTFNLGSVTTETNFSEYKIFYKTGSSGVTTGDTAYTSSSDSNLGSISYNSATTATVSSLSPNVQYVANIWAYDSYGQYTPASTEVSFYTLANRPTTSTVTATSTSALTLVIGQNSNPSNTEYAICQTSDGYTCASGGNVQSDGSLSSSSAAYQTYAAWGGASGINISGLQSNTAYQFIVKARNGNSVETNYSPANTAVYTYADQILSPVTTNSTNTTTVRASISFTMPSTLPNGMKIEQDSSCDSSYDTTIYDSSSSNTSSPFLVSGLTANTCYIFRFSSYNNDGVLNTVSRPTASSFTTSPGQVTNVRATSASESQITWSWDAVTAATAYDIYQAITGALLGSVIAPTIEYIQSSLSANTSYSIIVRALNDSGSGIASSIGTAVTNASVPTGVTHSAQTTDSITWGWTNGGQSAFYAQNKDTTSRNSGWIAETSWAETGLSANTQYTVQVKARNSENTETSFTEVAAYTAQNAPSSISFSSVSTTVISVAANGTFPNVGTGSAVIHFDNGAGSTQDMSNTSAWTNTGLSPNTQYTYTAYATNGDGDQTSSVNGSTTTLANTPDVPTVNNASTSSMTVIINLANNPASTEFSICQTSDGTSCASGGNLQANGTLSSSAAAWQSYTAWGGASGISVTGLTTGNGYRFLVKARNSANVQTNYSSASTIVYALSTSPGTPTVESVS